MGRLGCNMRVLMGVPTSQLTPNFGYLLTFTFLQQILLCHNPNFLYFSTSITFGRRPY